MRLPAEGVKPACQRDLAVRLNRGGLNHPIGAEIEIRIECAIRVDARDITPGLVEIARENDPAVGLDSGGINVSGAGTLCAGIERVGRNEIYRQSGHPAGGRAKRIADDDLDRVASICALHVGERERRTDCPRHRCAVAQPNVIQRGAANRRNSKDRRVTGADRLAGGLGGDDRLHDRQLRHRTGDDSRDVADNYGVVTAIGAKHVGQDQRRGGCAKDVSGIGKTHAILAPDKIQRLRPDHRHVESGDCGGLIGAARRVCQDEWRARGALGKPTRTTPGIADESPGADGCVGRQTLSGQFPAARNSGAGADGYPVHPVGRSLEGGAAHFRTAAPA